MALRRSPGPPELGARGPRPAPAGRPVSSPAFAPFAAAERWLPRLALAGALIAALAVRLWLNVRSDWMIDGDEALFGIAAERILHGAHPVFLFGVPYMGMLQSYAAAPFVAVLGPRFAALRAVTLLGSLAYVLVTWRLARAWYGARTAVLSAWLAAVPSLYFAASGLKVWGVYVGVMALGGLVLLGAWRCRQAAGALPRWAWFFLGVAVGLALWANFLVIYYLATAALLLPWRRLRCWLPPALLFGLPGLALGGLPLWAYNLRHGWATFRFVFGGAGASDPRTGAVAHVLWTTLLPRVAGVTSTWGEGPRSLRLALAVLLAAAIVLACIDAMRGVNPSLPSPFRRGSARGDWLQARAGQQPVGPTAWPLLLFLAMSLGIYLVSGFGRPSLTPWDASGRYLLPLWTALPILLAALCVRLGRLWPPLGAAALLVVLAANLAGYAASQPRLVFQSPYWDHLPLDNRPLLGWLEAHDVHAVWMNHWAGDQLMYLSDGAIQSADYYDIVVGHAINRLPDAFAAVQAAPRAAFVVVAPGEAHPPLEAELQKRHVAYTDATLGPYHVYLPTSRRVAPSEVANGLRYPY